jgi:CRISPR-associated endonuclease Cas1
MRPELYAPEPLQQSEPGTVDDADALASIASTFGRDTSDARICVADGHGLRIRVDRAHLVVHDGLGESRRTRRYARATHGLRRLVILGHSGRISIDSLRWCHRLGIEIAIVDPDANVIFASVLNVSDDARLRRAQVLAADNDLGLMIARELIAVRIAGQSRILRRRFGDAASADAIEELGSALAEVSSIDDVRSLESAAAGLYWACWRGREETAPMFAARERARLPKTWCEFGTRASVLRSANGNRRADRPVNAIVNWLTAVAEVEATIASHTVSLDPSFGFIHADTRARSSFSLDLLEVARAPIEEFVLDLLATRSLKRSDFVELPDGHCRILAPLTHELAETMPLWRQVLARHAERVAHLLGEHIDGKYVPTTRLTGAKQREAQARVKARKAQAALQKRPARQRQPASSTAPRAAATCVSCGASVERARHLRCPHCWAAQPGQDEETRRKRGRAIAASRAELERWKSTNPDARSDPEAFRHEILPGLQGVKLTDIMNATGMAKSSASMTRSGTRVPAVRHWDALARLANTHETRSQNSGASRT